MSSLIIVISPTWTILTPHYSIGLQWQPGGPAVLACRALLESSVMWCSSLSPKPVVFTWSTTHGQAPSSWQLSAWSFLVSTLCSLIATVYLSRFLKLKQHCGFPGPVPTSSWAGGLNSDQVDQTTLPKPKPEGVILVTEHNAEVNAGFAVLYGAPIMLLRFLRKTGREYHSTQANPKSLLFASTGRSWWLNIGSWSPQWFQMGEMTGT